MRRSSVIISIVLCFINHLAIAQNIRQISNVDGLDCSYVTSICEDIGGVLWIGTTDGVRRLLNQEVKPVDLGDGPILEDVIVHEIAETDDGVMWIATDKGLVKLDLHTGKQVTYHQFVGHYLIKGSVSRYEIAVLDNHQDLYIYNIKLDSFIRVPLPLQAENPISNFGFNEDYLWTSGVNGLIRYKYVRDGDRISCLDGFDIVLEGSILFCNKSEGGLYLVNDLHKLFHADLENALVEELIDLEEDIKSRGVPTGIARIENGFFISFRDWGVVRYLNGPNGWERFDLGIKAGVYRMKRDRHQALFWIATEGKGLYKYWESDHSFNSYRVSDYCSILSENINALYLDDENYLWLGTRGSGLLRLHRQIENGASVYGEAEVFNSSNSGLCHDAIRCITTFGKDDVLIGTKDGLCILNPRNKTIREVKGAEGIKEVNQIVTVNDTIWIATDVGIFQGQIDTGHGFSIRFPKRYTVGNGDMAANPFKALAYESERRLLWAGNRGLGLFCINPDAERPVLSDPELLDGVSWNVSSLLFDGHRLWIGTGAGVVVGDEEVTPIVINRDNNLGNNVIHALIPDGEEGVWASTNNSISRIDKSLSTIRNYGSQEGMTVTEFSDGAVFVSKDRVFFGGVGGWVEMVSNENPFMGNRFFPTIHFGEIIQNNKHTQIYLRAETESGDMQRIRIPYKDNSFGISFLVTDYIHQSDVRYQYSLTKRGAKDKWTDNGYSASVNFSNLPFGYYTLKARCSYPIPDLESNEISLDLQILPPWYLSVYAHVVYGLLGILSIVFLGILIRRKEIKARARQKEELERQKQTELFQDKLTFFTNITHEFCTPLTLIFGPCEMLDKYEKSDAYIRKYARIIRNNTLRLNALIHDVIEFSKVETNHYKVNISDVSISGVVMSIFDSFREMARQSNIDYQAVVPENLFWKSDEGCIYSIVSNLLSNAIKYTPENGAISVSAAIEDDKLAIKVKNTGAGIPEKEIDHLFDRYRIMGKVEGKEKKGLVEQNGLGLAICKSMVTLLEGSISVDSVPGEYAEFRVILPALSGQQRVSSPVSSSGITRSPDVAKLLVVDDDTDILALLEDALSSYQVTTCDNAADGIRIIKEDRPDLIITDVMMRGMNGLEFIRKCKEDALIRHIPVIMISAKKAAEEKIDGYNAGCDVYIEKPFEIKYLLSVVNRLLAKKDQDKQYYNSSASLFVYDNGKKVNLEDKKFIDRLNDYVSKNLQSQITVADLASFFNVGTRNLYRRFSSIGLPPPNEYIKAFRLNYAGRLLRTTSLSIKEIMFDCGFNSKGHFYSEFEKQYAMSPKQFRLQSLDSDEPAND